MMGLLSNGNTYPERCGLGGYFQFVVFAQEHGIQKPDPRLFEIAIERARCAKHQLLHVGDSFQNDIIGAKQAGIKSVWLNRQCEDKEMKEQPDFEISSLTELIEVLESVM